MWENQGFSEWCRKATRLILHKGKSTLHRLYSLASTPLRGGAYAPLFAIAKTSREQSMLDILASKLADMPYIDYTYSENERSTKL